MLETAGARGIPLPDLRSHASIRGRRSPPLLFGALPAGGPRRLARGEISHRHQRRRSRGRNRAGDFGRSGEAVDRGPLRPAYPNMRFAMRGTFFVATARVRDNFRRLDGAAGSRIEIQDPSGRAVTGRGAVWQRVRFGTERSEVQILSPRQHNFLRRVVDDPACAWPSSPRLSPAA
jgi:hypothetical protein